MCVSANDAVSDPKKSRLVGMEVVMGRNVPRVVRSVSWIRGKEVANMRSDPGVIRSKVAMPILELTIGRMDGRISI